jgi:3-hydroxyacyl-CoA dehydrogenase
MLGVEHRGAPFMADHRTFRQKLMDSTFGNFVVGCCALAMTIIGGTISVVVYVSRRIATIGLMAAKDNDKLQLEETAARELLRTDLTARIELNRTDAERNHQRLDARVEAVQERSASKTELIALEARTVASLAKLEGNIANLIEKTSQIPAIAAQCEMIGRMVERLLKLREGEDG